MNPNWAEENLQTIRTLMERSALYRRALAPIMTLVGIVGFFAAVFGWLLKITATAAFVSYWFSIAAIALTGAFLLARRQAWQETEPFWSPPTRRIAQAIFPPLLAGFVFGVLVIYLDRQPSESDPPTGGWPPNPLVFVFLPLLWAILYGCAIHAAGFFISRGMRVFGLTIVILGCGGFAFMGITSGEGLVDFAYAAMGFFFGVLHLACGTYLAVTEKGKNAA